MSRQSEKVGDTVSRWVENYEHAGRREGDGNVHLL